MRRLSLVALALAGGAIPAASPRAVAQETPVVQESTLTATISQSIEADTNYNLDEDPPGTTYFGDTRLGIDLIRGTETQNLRFELDTGLRALQQPEQDFEWVIASPSSARLGYDQVGANHEFDLEARARVNRVDRALDELVFEDDLPALPEDPEDVTQAGADTYVQRYDLNTGFVTGTAAPSAIGFRLRASEVDYSGDNRDDFVARTGADGDVFWRLRLNPVLSSVVSGSYSYEDADDDQETQINYSVVDLGLLYEPREEASVGFGVGYAVRDERTTDAAGDRETETSQGVALRGQAGYATENLSFGLNLFFTTAAPNNRFSGDFRMSYQQLRGRITARLFQDYGLGSEGEDRRVTGGELGYEYPINSISDLSFALSARSSTSAEDISDTDDDGDRSDLSFTTEYSYAFSEVVAASVGYDLTRRREDDEDATSNRFFFRIGRSFVTGF
jgi:hypothetical protein